MRATHHLRSLLLAATAGLVLVGCDAVAVDPGHTPGAHRTEDATGGGAMHSDDGHGAMDGDGHGAMHGDVEDSPPIDGADELAVTADALAFEPARIELAPGEPINVELTSRDTFHDLVVDEVDFHLGADASRSVTGGLVLDEPGTYVGYCSVPGHRSAGMELEFVVG
jgi:plastocyanin